MKDNLRIGRGKYMFLGGSFYEGYWKDDMPYGFGRIINASGDYY
jgi:hypothetical protein